MSHRAFAVPAPAVAPRAAGGRSEWPWQERVERLNQRDGFELPDADRHSQQAHATQLVGYFGVDREGVVRWRYLEAERRPEDIGTLPTEADLLVAGRALAG